ncbi:MAG: DUF3343 domain-containing protein [Spirochaetales bacterium]|nr:DUF3343 domain-containing protein [Spirochaetales bacterium]
MHEMLFTFQNTHQALKAEKYLKNLKYQVKLIPTPFEIFSECGFSLLVFLSEEGHETLSRDETLNHVDCYLIIKEDERNSAYEKI